MHLPKLPTICVKNGEERKAFFTVQARELLAAGWVEKVDEVQDIKTKAKKAEKQVEQKKKEGVKRKAASKPTPQPEKPEPVSPESPVITTPSSVEE